MKLLVISEYGQSKVVTSDILPRIGDSVDLFYSPLPKVSVVVLWPSEDKLEALDDNLTDIDAIITVS